MEQARERATAAREILEAGHLAPAVSVAYYAMLNAARAALSEEDENSRTHRGTWNLFRLHYVTTEAFDAALYTLSQQAQAAREGGDYQAVTPNAVDAERYVDGAADFVVAVEEMLSA